MSKIVSVSKNSFTLLEIAVVMVIITIITTATFKGRSLLDNAKLIAIKADIDNISKKSNQFEGQYGSLPGDLANASSLWSGASNGNGNGIIDTSFEALYFWQHLQLAGLITGNYDGASSYVIFDPNNSSLAGGVYKSSFEGGMYSISNDANYGLTVTLSSTLGSNYTTAILTPTQAYNLDSKYDDGTGKMYEFSYVANPYNDDGFNFSAMNGGYVYENGFSAYTNIENTSYYYDTPPNSGCSNYSYNYNGYLWTWTACGNSTATTPSYSIQFLP